MIYIDNFLLHYYYRKSWRLPKKIMALYGGYMGKRKSRKAEIRQRRHRRAKRLKQREKELIIKAQAKKEKNE